MAPFNIDAALHGALVVTRDGRSVEGLYIEQMGWECVLAGYIGNSRFKWGWDGRYLLAEESAYDLFMAPFEETQNG